MLNALSLSHLLTPVMYRAEANLSTRTQGFSDRFAQSVLLRLESKFQFEKNELNTECQDQAILRCAWIDEQLLRFIEEAPEAECIEIECGLSTRFHRLSEKLEWPQFSWSTINTIDVNDCLEYVFPQLDNHRCIACTQPQKQCINHIHWHSNKAKILILNEVYPLNDWHEFIELLGSIQNAMDTTESLKKLDFILTHTIDNFSELLFEHSNTVEVIASYEAKPRKLSALEGLISLFQHPSQIHKTHTHHLRVSQNTSEKPS